MFSAKSKDRVRFPNHDIGVYVMTHGPTCTHLPGDYCIPFEIGAVFRDNFKPCGTIWERSIFLRKINYIMS